MNETPNDLARLQALLTRSIERAGEHLKRTFEMPEHSLDAVQLVRYIGQEQQYALATVTARGEPRVAPVQVVLQRGHFFVPTAADAVRTGHVARRPSVSMTHWVSNEVALITHGRAVVIGHSDAEFDELSEAYVRDWWQELRRRRNGAFLRVEPDALYTWARDPSAFPRD